MSCGNAGAQYPQQKIDQFIDDNKALLRRMYGEPQEPASAAKTKQRVVRTFRQEKRYRRDILEGTLEEMLMEFDDGNQTFSRDRRQTDYPGPIESNKEK